MLVELTVRDVAVLVAKLVVRAVPVADFVIVDAVAGFLTVSLLLVRRKGDMAIGKFFRENSRETQGLPQWLASCKRRSSGCGSLFNCWLRCGGRRARCQFRCG